MLFCSNMGNPDISDAGSIKNSSFFKTWPQINVVGEIPKTNENKWVLKLQSFCCTMMNRSIKDCSKSNKLVFGDYTLVEFGITEIRFWIWDCGIISNRQQRWTEIPISHLISKIPTSSMVLMVKSQFSPWKLQNCLLEIVGSRQVPAALTHWGNLPILNFRASTSSGGLNFSMRNWRGGQVSVHTIF